MTKPKYMFLDIETTGLSPFKHELHGMGVAFDDGSPTYYLKDRVPVAVVRALADPQIIKVNHNLRAFDLNFISHNQGYTIAGELYCTLVMSLVDDDSLPAHGLKELTAIYFGAQHLDQKNDLDLLIEKLKLKHVGELCALDLQNAQRPYSNLIGKYCCEDVDNTRRLFKLQKIHLQQQHKDALAAGYTETPLTYFKDEIVPTERVLLEIEKNGVRIDKQFLDKLREETIQERDELTAQLMELAAPEIAKVEEWLLRKSCSKVGEKGKASRIANPRKYEDCVFNLGSPAHFGKLIYEELKCPFDLIKRTKKRAYLTKEDHLKLIFASIDADSKLSLVLALYARIKKTAKIINTYTGDSSKGIASLLQNNPTTGESWLYPQYKQTPATGRLACFPIQQLPRKGRIKRFFMPSSPDRCFVYSDSSAVEFRNAAHLSQDPVMLKMIRENIDPHITLAARIFGIPEAQVTKEQRNVGKTVNYLMLYGGEEARLMQELALKNQLKFTRQECRRFLDTTFELYSGYRAYLDRLKEEMETTLRVVAPNGRVRRLPDIEFGRYLDHANKRFIGPEYLRLQLLESENERPKASDLYYRARGRYKHALNSGFNHPNQSLGGTEMKRALKQLSDEGFCIRATIHDAVIVETLKSAAQQTATRVKEIMESCYPLSVPLKSDTKILNSFDEQDTVSFDR